MTDFEVTMKKISAKLEMLKTVRNEWHQLLLRNKIKELKKLRNSFMTEVPTI